MQRLIEKINGKGVATGPDGTSREITCNLDVYQEMIPTGNQGDPNTTIPGLKDIRGRISPACFVGVNGVTLHMQDGRKMALLVSAGGTAHASPME